jgi:hypothetical protein
MLVTRTYRQPLRTELAEGACSNEHGWVKVCGTAIVAVDAPTVHDRRRRQVRDVAVLNVWVGVNKHRCITRRDVPQRVHPSAVPLGGGVVPLLYKQMLFPVMIEHDEDTDGRLIVFELGCMHPVVGHEQVTEQSHISYEHRSTTKCQKPNKNFLGPCPHGKLGS